MEEPKHPEDMTWEEFHETFPEATREHHNAFLRVKAAKEIMKDEALRGFEKEG